MDLSEKDKVKSDIYPDYGVGIIRLIYPDNSILVYWPTLKEKNVKGYCIYRYYSNEIDNFEKIS